MPALRRTLTFSTLDDVSRDAENLLASGYDKAGNWDLPQVCAHLSDWMRFPVDGFPKALLPIRMMMSMVRVTMGKAMLGKVLAQGFKPGRPTMPETVHTAGGNAAAAVEKLKETVERFKAHEGPIHPSPLFGAMTKDEAMRLQLAHCAHHLSFLVPRTPPG